MQNIAAMKTLSRNDCGLVGRLKTRCLYQSKNIQNRCYMRTVSIKDIGPVKSLTLSIPDTGGICVLRARNGAGKTKALEAVNSLISGNGSLECRDGSLRGEISGFGAKIAVGRSTRRSGELEVTGLEGRFDISMLIDPGLKSPDAADCLLYTSDAADDTR